SEGLQFPFMWSSRVSRLGISRLLASCPGRAEIARLRVTTGVQYPLLNSGGRSELVSHHSHALQYHDVTTGGRQRERYERDGAHRCAKAVLAAAALLVSCDSGNDDDHKGEQLLEAARTCNVSDVER
ncbi:unnamed protein product, partial [Ranitomeya imitator]